MRLSMNRDSLAGGWHLNSVDLPVPDVVFAASLRKNKETERKTGPVGRLVCFRFEAREPHDLNTHPSRSHTHVGRGVYRVLYRV